MPSFSRKPKLVLTMSWMERESEESVYTEITFSASGGADGYIRAMCLLPLLLCLEARTCRFLTRHLVTQVSSIG